ncbi:Zn-ribbon domain-containing OB-fold protein [Haloplanus sp. GCM10025708]|uniref:Zn-ribbon domain-containing OB-fold protein n=1 Tax=Haloferacaceae TaxID=1644056 RepID=UPI0036119A9F
MTPEELTPDSPFTLPGFFDALSDGRLVAAVCSCGEVLVPPRTACYACGGRDLELEDQPRTGEIYSYTEVRTAPPAFEDDAPYTVAVVELDSGARLLGRVDADYDAVAIGDDVELRVRDPTEAEREIALSHEQDWPIHVFETV